VTEPLTIERLAEIRAARAATSPGPWRWSGNTATQQMSLTCWVPGWGRTTVMDFVRWGMRGAQPRFRGGSIMHKGSDLAVWEVNRAAIDPADPSLYRHDVVGLRSPDAAFIADAPGYVDDLLAEVDRLRAANATAVAALHADVGNCSRASVVEALDALVPA
jgi:hypothetical protein